MSRGQRYGYRSKRGLLPCVEVVSPTTVTEHGYYPTQVVARKYGLTWNHAISRALKWMKDHGDPR